MTYRSRMRFVLEGLEGITFFFAALVSWPLTRRWLANWGSTEAERERRWKGDELVEAPHRTYTRAVTIQASAATIWSWIVQFGLGRAGFYSYELLERLVGIPATNVESIEPELQSLSVGEMIQLHPKDPGIPLAYSEPGRHICFGGASGSGASGPDPARSWSMYIEPEGNASCRLLLRACVGFPRDPSWVKRVGLALEEPLDFVMEQRMLRTIRRLATGSGKSSS